MSGDKVIDFCIIWMGASIAISLLSMLLFKIIGDFKNK